MNDIRPFEEYKEMIKEQQKLEYISEIENVKKEIENKISSGWVKTFENSDYVILDKFKNGRVDKKTVYKIS